MLEIWGFILTVLGIIFAFNTPKNIILDTFKVYHKKINGKDNHILISVIGNASSGKTSIISGSLHALSTLKPIIKGSVDISTGFPNSIWHKITSTFIPYRTYPIYSEVIKLKITDKNTIKYITIRDVNAVHKTALTQHNFFNKNYDKVINSIIYSDSLWFVIDITDYMCCDFDKETNLNKLTVYENISLLQNIAEKRRQLGIFSKLSICIIFMKFDLIGNNLTKEALIAEMSEFINASRKITEDTNYFFISAVHDFSSQKNNHYNNIIEPLEWTIKKSK